MLIAFKTNSSCSCIPLLFSSVITNQFFIFSSPASCYLQSSLFSKSFIIFLCSQTGITINVFIASNCFSRGYVFILMDKIEPSGGQQNSVVPSLFFFSKLNGSLIQCQQLLDIYYLDHPLFLHYHQKSISTLKNLKNHLPHYHLFQKSVSTNNLCFFYQGFYFKFDFSNNNIFFKIIFIRISNNWFSIYINV